MNERIRELVKLTDGQFYEGFAGSTNFVKFAEDDLQKFAELIVRECAGRVDNILRERKDGGGTMGDEIREHFGVEE